MSTLYTIALSISILAACAGTGRLASRLWHSKQEKPSDGLLIDTALGAGILSLILFVLGILQLYTLPILIAVLTIPILALVASVACSRCRDQRSRVPSVPSTLHYPLSTLCALLFVVLFVAAIIPALAPPAMSDWDSLAYHLAVPKLYLAHGGIYHIGVMSHSNFPLLMEMLYLPAVKLGLPEAARTLNFFVGVLLVAAVAMLTRRHFSAKAAPLAALGLAGMPIVLFLATTAYIDLATALYTIISIHLLLSHLDTRERACLIGSAIAAGLAASTKMTGLVTIPLVAIWFLADRWATDRKFELKPALMFAGVAMAVCLPWYIKTFIYTGNPVYPFFYGLFGGRGWSTELASHYATQQSLFGMGHDLRAFLMLPWNLAFRSDAFYDTAGLFVGPVFLVAVPLLFTAKYRSRKLAGLLGFFLAYVAIWFGLTHQSRYLIPGFAVLSVLVAAIVYEDDRFKVVRQALMLVFAATALFGIYTLWPAIANSAPVVFGSETREQYLSHSLDIYRAELFINSHLPANAKVALMGDTRGYYLDRAYVWADGGHNLEFTHQYATPEDFATYLKSQGVTHVMINFGFFAPRDKGGELYYAAIDKGLLQQIYPSEGELGRVAVYEVR